MGEAAPDTAAMALEARGVSKAFGSVQALSDVDLAVRHGSVHGLVGENGSGKSTLTKIIAGVVSPDAGQVVVEGRELEAFDPRRSRQRGIRVIYQDLALFPNLSVAENVTFAGDVPLRSRIRWRDVRARAAAALEHLGLELDLSTPVGELAAAERQLVAIARAVSSDARIVLMDEPTAALTKDEVDRLLATIRTLSGQGLSFVFISHKLREVVDIADDVTVLRNGEVMASDAADRFDQERISVLMTGSAVREQQRGTRSSPVGEEPVLEVRGLTLRSAFVDVDLDLYPGRVLGLGGLVGSGRTEIALAISGLIRVEDGEIRFRGQPVRSPRSLAELQYVPEDRLTEGLFLDWSVAENIVTQDIGEITGPAGTLKPEWADEVGKRWRDRLAIKTDSVQAPVQTLSGGNQQRVLLARALAPDPQVVLLNNPTVGVDVGSRAEIHDRIRAVADDGTALIVISDEPSELMSVCDEVLIVHRGKVTHRRATSELDETQIWDLIVQERAAT